MTATRPRITLLAVGGTIAMTASEHGGVVPGLDATALTAAVPGLGEAAELAIRDVAATPGPHMDLDTVLAIRDAAREALADGADGIVVSQGTDSIDETAFALQLLLDTDAPVVMTGALRHPAQAGADGPANLLDAVTVAGSAGAAGRGVLVVLNATVHRADRVTKAHTSRPDAFRSWPGPEGELREGRCAFHAAPSRPRCGIAASCREPAPVALLTASIADDGRLVDTLPMIGYRALVVDALGGGHVPPPMMARLENLPEGFPVVVASRTGAGSTLRGTYGYRGGELDLARMGAIRAGTLNGLKARAATAVLLGAGGDGDTLRDFFREYDG